MPAWPEPYRIAGALLLPSWTLPRGPESSRRQAGHYCKAGTLLSPSWTLPLGQNPPVAKLDTTARPEPSRCQAGHYRKAGALPPPSWTLPQGRNPPVASWTLPQGWSPPIAKLDTIAILPPRQGYNIICMLLYMFSIHM